VVRATRSLVTPVWSDTLLAAERNRALAGVVWGACSLAVGIVAILITRRRGERSPLIFHFGAQMLAWGAGVVVLAIASYATIAPRDLASAVRLERSLWFGSGLELGIAAAGAAIAVVSWVAGRRLGGVGAGMTVILQGLALAILDMRLAATITR
jgi:hypothetical protein